MIAWTTPTVPIVVTSGQLEATHCDVYVSFRQSCNVETLKPTSMQSDEENDKTLLLVDLSQLQTGNLSYGVTDVQVNIIDWNGYRAATPWKTILIGSNIINKELEHDGF